MAAAVEFELLVQGEEGWDVVVLGCGCLGGERGVEVCDVGLVVLLVM